MNKYLDSSLDDDKIKQYWFPVPVTKTILKENKMLAFNKNMPPEKLWEERPFLVDESPISHNEKNNTIYAIDFLVEIWTPILAVESGKVWYVREDSFEYWWGNEFGDKANYIWISHDNDIISEYIHLSIWSVTEAWLKVWDLVKKWQKIWKTWLSWWMDIPHLHFALYKNIWSGKVQNIKINFQKKLWWALYR